MRAAGAPRWAAVVGVAFLVALAGWTPGAAAGAMPHGQNRRPAKQEIPVVWRQSVTGNRGIPVVVRLTQGPMTASIVRPRSTGRAAAGGAVRTLIGVSSSGARSVQLSSPHETTMQVPRVNEEAIQTSTPVARSTPLRGVQVYLGTEPEPSAPAARLQARSVNPPANYSTVGVRPATQDPIPPVPQKLTIESPRVRVAGDDPGDYRLGPGDLIDVFVWRNPELSRKVPVRPDGRISLPLVGEMIATGKTTRQVQDEITATLAQYIQAPTVTVTVTEIHSLVVYVVGNVAKPGPLELSRNVTVLQAISMAGGLNEFAKKNDITILRTVNGEQQRIPFRYGDFVKGKGRRPEILLRAGDVVYVP